MISGWLLVLISFTYISILFVIAWAGDNTLARGASDLDPLLVGKIAEEHIPIVRELQYRKVLKPAPIRPRYLLDPEALRRLDGLRTPEASVLSLVGLRTESGATHA